jgi:ferredoxin-NADP reductase
MIYTLTNRNTRQTREIDVVTDTDAYRAAQAFAHETGDPVRVADDKGRVVARSLTVVTAPAGFTLSVFEDVALSMIRAGHGRTDLIAACNRASDRRTQEVAAATYGARA